MSPLIISEAEGSLTGEINQVSTGGAMIVDPLADSAETGQLTEGLSSIQTPITNTHDAQSKAAHDPILPTLTHTFSNDRISRLQQQVASCPIRIASPSPHRLPNQLLAQVSEDKIDIAKVRKRAMKKKNRKRDITPVPAATFTIRGFQTPTQSCGEESDMSGASTPVMAPISRYNSSVTNSPSIRPATPSGISALKLQLDSLTLNSRTSTLRSISMQRTSTSGSRTSEGSDSERTEMDSYEIPLQNDFVSSDVLPKSQIPLVGENTRRQTLYRKMSAADFEPMTCLGKGTYGTVILVKHRETGRLFAQKQLKKASLVVRKKLVEQTKTERAILESVNRYPFVVKLFYAFQDHEKLYLILEYAQGGELFHHLNMERMFPEETAAFYMAEMILALEHLHRNLGVVYRDLKPENCLLDSDGHLLLTDFGLSKVAVDEDAKCNSFLGTIEYMAPEIVQGHEYGMAVDWWSLGALGHDLLTGAPPFTGNNNAKIQQKIIQCKLQLPYYLGPDAKDLLIRLLRKDPKKRLGFNMPKDLHTIKNHRFFRKIDWKKLANRELTPPIQPLITDPELAENFSTSFTDLALSPRVSRTSFGAADVEEGMQMDVDKDLFGGFSFTASESLLDYGGILDGGGDWE